MASRAALLVLLVAACDGGGGGSGPDAGQHDATVHDAAPPYDPLDGVGSVELVAGGFGFLEGPQWITFDGTGSLAFSDIPGNTVHRLVPPSTISVMRSPSGNSNGLALDADLGGLYAAQHGTRSVTGGPFSGPTITVARLYGGARLNSPNDLIVRSDATLYFTDPPYGIDDADRELDFMGVFRIPPSGGEPVAEWMGSLEQRPNGIGLSPDEQILYVSDTADGVVRAWDVADDGSLSGERVLSTDVPGADGLAIDAAGNLFVTTSAGVRVLSPAGDTWGTIAVPEQPANCAFGGDDALTLYITARTSLYRVTLVHPGLP